MASLSKSSKGDVVALFPIVELAALYSSSKTQKLKEALFSRGLTLVDMVFQTSRFRTMMQELVVQMTNHRDEHEIFVALFGLVSFIGDDIEIGFVLSPKFTVGKDHINNIEDLYRFRNMYSDIDFLIKRGDGVREFQLKRFKKVLSTENLLAELKKVIAHYGNRLGDVNLLFIMQQTETEESIDFRMISETLAAILPADDPAQVLLRFRDNESDIIVSLHPKVAKQEVPIELPSQILSRLTKNAARRGSTGG